MPRRDSLGRIWKGGQAPSLKSRRRKIVVLCFFRDSKSCLSTNEYKCRHLLFTLYDLKSAYISPLPTLAGIVPMHDISNRPLSPACRSETLMVSWLDEYVGRLRTSLMLLVGFEAVRGSFKCRRILWNVFKAFLLDGK